jgi:ribonuclease HI
MAHARGNPGRGAWAAILIDKEQLRTISGGVAATTNNRMELQAAIEALRALHQPCQGVIFTDSQYLQNGISKWLSKWKARGWRTSDRKRVKNEDLWRELDAEAAKHRITWKWIKGHAGDDLHDRCDRLARSAILTIRQHHTSDELNLSLE